MTELRPDRAALRDALASGGDFAAVSSRLVKAVDVAIDVGDVGHHEVSASVDAYGRHERDVARLWRRLTQVARRAGGDATDWSVEAQARRLRALKSERIDADPLIWALLLLHIRKLEPRLALGPDAPAVNRIGYALGFRPDLLWDAWARRWLEANRTGGAGGALVEDSAYWVHAFADFYLGKIAPIKQVSLQRRMELARLEERALNLLDFWGTVGEVHRGWMMVGFSFLAPYALAPEVFGIGVFAGAGRVVGAGGLLRSATQAERLAHFAADGGLVVLRIAEIGGPFIDLSHTLGTIFFERPPDTPLTPGEMFVLFIDVIGAIPSARLGYAMTGLSIATTLETSEDFVQWLDQTLAALEMQLAAQEVGLSSETYDSAHSFVVDL